MNDFSKMVYDVSLPGNLVDNYPDLKEFREFQNPADDLYLKLASLISDEESPFVKKEKDFTKIVTRSCDFLGIDDFEFTQSLIIGSSISPFADNLADKVRRFIHLLFTNQNNWAFQTWFNYLFSFHECSLVIRTPLNPEDTKYEEKAKKKQDMLKQLPELQKTLVAYENQIFPNAKVKQIVTQQTAKIINWPEKMAKEQPIYKPVY